MCQFAVTGVLCAVQERVRLPETSPILSADLGVDLQTDLKFYRVRMVLMCVSELAGRSGIPAPILRYCEEPGPLLDHRSPVGRAASP